MFIKTIKPLILTVNNNLYRYQFRVRYLMTSSRCLVRHKRKVVDEEGASVSPLPSSSSVTSTSQAEPNNAIAWLEKLLYSSFLEKYSYRQDYRQRLLEQRESVLNETKQAIRLSRKASSVVALKYIEELKDIKEIPDAPKPREQMVIDEINEQQYSGDVQFPYQIYTKYSAVAEQTETGTVSEVDKENSQGFSQNQNNRLDEDQGKSDDHSWVHTYGTPNPNIPASNTPCGGCGAFLHCQDTAVPGYIPSESYKVLSEKELKTQICQRCYFLKVHDAALNVNVSPKDYPEILKHIQDKRALVILLVDLIDFPCSIWPGISKIIGEKRPVILVGNKVDLIPRDSKRYLQRIQESLKLAAEDAGLNKLKILATHLISASSGYGVEGLITTIHDLWGNKGDIYIMGCTNVGKSTLFNVFIQSDLCKVQAVDLVQRATVSPWPGTTLNLLKFPVFKPDGWVLSLRHERMKNWAASEREEQQLREFQLKETKQPIYASLIGHVGRSYTRQEDVDDAEWLNNNVDLFHVNPHSLGEPHLTQRGKIDFDDPLYRAGKWCYDTPGTVNKNQILDQLLLPELMRILPKKTIQPRSYYLQLGTTLFVGGLARIDNSGDQPLTCTVFTSDFIPITIVHTDDADEIYQKALGTPILGVPLGDKERLAKFPPFKSHKFEVRGLDNRKSCCDIVISATGWVAITAKNDRLCKMTVHTPRGAGVFCRQPALLPYAVGLKGKRIRNTFAYNKHRLYVPHPNSKI